jgi:hypothetical protein
MKIGFPSIGSALAGLKLPNKGEWGRIIKKHANIFREDMCITIITRNPNNRDVQKDLETNLTWPCYKVEAEKSGDVWKGSLYLHVIPSEQTQLLVYQVLDKDPKMRKHYPDRIIAIEEIPINGTTEQGFDLSQLSSYALSEAKA